MKDCQIKGITVSSFSLKLIAMVAMVMDHAACAFVSEPIELYYELRAFGRLAMPIFCFLISRGFKKTSNKRRYALRLFAFAFLSEIPFNLCFSGSLISQGSLNVMFTLLFGLCALTCIDFIYKRLTGVIRVISFLPAILFVIAAELLSVDYGAYGVMLVVLFGLFDHESAQGKIVNCVFTVLFSVRYILTYAVNRALLAASCIDALAPLSTWNVFQMFAVLSVFPILLYDGCKGFTPKAEWAKKAVQYSFYLFYPAHLLVFALISK